MRIAIVACITVVASPAIAQAVADAGANPARGIRTCQVTQWNSAHRLAEQNRGSMLPSTIAPSSIVRFEVARDGSVAVRISRTLYPGSRVYFLIAGQRMAWPENARKRITASALAALKRDEPFDASYQVWPYRRDIPHSDRYVGFAAAYERCVQHMRGR